MSAAKVNWTMLKRNLVLFCLFLALCAGAIFLASSWRDFRASGLTKGGYAVLYDAVECINRFKSESGRLPRDEREILAAVEKYSGSEITRKGLVDKGIVKLYPVVDEKGRYGYCIILEVNPRNFDATIVGIVENTLVDGKWVGSLNVYARNNSYRKW